MLYAQLGLKRSVLISLVLMAVSNFSFALLAAGGHSNLGMAAAIGFENFASGIGGVGVVAYFSALCDLRFTASQYALISAAASIVGRILTGPRPALMRHGLCPLLPADDAAAVPGICFSGMMRSGLVDSSIGSAGTAGSGDVTAGESDRSRQRSQGEAQGQAQAQAEAEAEAEAEDALVRKFAVGCERFAGQVERAEDRDRRAAGAADRVFQARSRRGGGKAERQREARELGGLVAFVPGHRAPQPSGKRSRRAARGSRAHPCWRAGRSPAAAAARAAA